MSFGENAQGTAKDQEAEQRPEGVQGEQRRGTLPRAQPEIPPCTLLSCRGWGSALAHTTSTWGTFQNMPAKVIKLELLQAGPSPDIIFFLKLHK